MRSLLVVDDYDSVLATLEYVLALQGVRVLSAKSGAAAVQLCETEKIDAALIALHMPSMDGIAACRRLRQRAHERGQILPVWIMTAAHTRLAEKNAREAGAMALLKKPFDCAALLAEIEACLDGKIPIPPLAAPANGPTSPNA